MRFSRFGKAHFGADSSDSLSSEYVFLSENSRCRPFGKSVCTESRVFKRHQSVYKETHFSIEGSILFFHPYS